MGCGWAFRSAAWLTDAITDALRDGGDVRRALRSYRRAHRFIARYDDLGRREALAKPAKPAKPLQRAIRAAALSDPDIARRVALFSMRAAEPSILLNPKAVVRAVARSWVRR